MKQDNFDKIILTHDGEDAAECGERCKCRGIVLKAYNGMLDTGAPKRTAMDVASKVYIYHHPEDAGPRARLIVERWVHAGNMH